LRKRMQMGSIILVALFLASLSISPASACYKGLFGSDGMIRLDPSEDWHLGNGAVWIYDTKWLKVVFCVVDVWPYEFFTWYYRITKYSKYPAPEDPGEGYMTLKIEAVNPWDYSNITVQFWTVLYDGLLVGVERALGYHPSGVMNIGICYGPEEEIPEPYWSPLARGKYYPSEWLPEWGPWPIGEVKISIWFEEGVPDLLKVTLTDGSEPGTYFHQIVIYEENPYPNTRLAIHADGDLGYIVLWIRTWYWEAYVYREPGSYLALEMHGTEFWLP